MIKVTVDGVSQEYTIYRGSASHKAYRIASDLEYGEHTVTIEAVSVPSGYDLEIRALMVEGDAEFNGVSFQSVKQ